MQIVQIQIYVCIVLCRKWRPHLPARPRAARPETTTKCDKNNNNNNDNDNDNDNNNNNSSSNDNNNDNNNDSGNHNNNSDENSNWTNSIDWKYGQFSKVQSGRMGPAPGRFELPKGVLGGKSAMVLGFETIH